ncbi:USP, partial [Symbiodinium pilosum]
VRQLQGRIIAPTCSQFEAYGKMYFLPLRVQNAQLRCEMPQHAVEYLAGFFDGDGCADYSNKGARLAIVQSVANAKVLLFYRNVFGGAIYTSGAARGVSQPLLKWEITGDRAAHAATVLGSLPTCKQPQLRIMSSWPSQSTAPLEAVTDLRLLKHLSPMTSSCPSWAFLAGFFDAEGCIHLSL